LEFQPQINKYNYLSDLHPSILSRLSYLSFQGYRMLLLDFVYEWKGSELELLLGTELGRPAESLGAAGALLPFHQSSF